MANINEDTPLLRRFSIPTVFTQPGCFEQMSDKTNFEEEYNTPACKYLPLAHLHRSIPLLCTYVSLAIDLITSLSFVTSLKTFSFVPVTFVFSSPYILPLCLSSFSLVFENSFSYHLSHRHIPILKNADQARGPLTPTDAPSDSPPRLQSQIPRKHTRRFCRSHRDWRTRGRNGRSHNQRRRGRFIPRQHTKPLFRTARKNHRLRLEFYSSVADIRGT
jgi:hypothetical protein